MTSKTTTQKGKQNFWARMNMRSRMFFVLALCFAMLLISAALAFFLVWGGGSAPAESEAPSSEALVAESGYNKDQNTIDATQYDTTILQESTDAGQSYVDETLFLGDSNTVRMYRDSGFNYCTDKNAVGSVGMSASALANYACVKFDGYKGYKTMPEAVAMLQPQRVIITFGTNDLGSGSAENFISSYQKGVQAVQAAYPSVDIIINSIPPLGKEHSNEKLTQKQVDEYNKAIVEMCKENDWKYLNSAEVLKDGTSGYAKTGYVETSDGIHLTKPAMEALFSYIRTHSYITDDDRPTLTTIPVRNGAGDKDVSVYTLPTSQPATAAPTATAAPESTDSSSGSEATNYTFWDETIAPTCTNQGYTIHHCNEDSSRDYTDSYTDTVAHTPVTNADGSVTCSVCGQLLQGAPATETPPAVTPAPPAETPTQAPPAETPTQAPPADSTAAPDAGSSSGGEIQIG